MPCRSRGCVEQYWARVPLDGFSNLPCDLLKPDGLTVMMQAGDNELIALEIIHRYVELLDKYFGSVSNTMSTRVKKYLG